MEPEMFLPSTVLGHVTKYCNHMVSSQDENNNIKKVYWWGEKLSPPQNNFFDSHKVYLWRIINIFIKKNEKNVDLDTPKFWIKLQGPVVQSVVSLMSSLRVISLTVLADSIYNILIFFAEKMWVAFALQKLLTFFSKKFQHICVSLDVNFNESLTNDVVSFEQLGPVVNIVLYICPCSV